MVPASTDFRQNNIPMPESNRMTIGRDVDLERILVAFNDPMTANLEQLRMHLLGIQVKVQFGNTGTNGQHEWVLFC